MNKRKKGKWDNYRKYRYSEGGWSEVDFLLFFWLNVPGRTWTCLPVVAPPQSSFKKRTARVVVGQNDLKLPAAVDPIISICTWAATVLVLIRVTNPSHRTVAVSSIPCFNTDPSWILPSDRPGAFFATVYRRKETKKRTRTRRSKRAKRSRSVRNEDYSHNQRGDDEMNLKAVLVVVSVFCIGQVPAHTYETDDAIIVEGKTNLRSAPFIHFGIQAGADDRSYWFRRVSKGPHLNRPGLPVTITMHQTVLSIGRPDVANTDNPLGAEDRTSLCATAYDAREFDEL